MNTIIIGYDFKTNSFEATFKSGAKICHLTEKGEEGNIFRQFLQDCLRKFSVKEYSYIYSSSLEELVYSRDYLVWTQEDMILNEEKLNSLEDGTYILKAKSGDFRYRKNSEGYYTLI